jgi:hypothetical protein
MPKANAGLGNGENAELFGRSSNLRFDLLSEDNLTIKPKIGLGT